MSEISKFFERLGKLIPGYSGYSDRNSIRESDYQMRLYLQKEIETLLYQIDKSKSSFDDETLLKIDTLQNNLRLFSVKIVNQSYGYSAMFDDKDSETDIREEKLNSLVNNDKDMINIIENLDIETNDVDGLRSLEKNLEDILIKRKEILR